MAYIDQLLGSGEQVRYVGRQHLLVLIGRILLELGLIAVLVAAGVTSARAFSGQELVAGLTVGQLILLICAAIGVIVLISALLDYLRWTTEQYLITDRRVIQIEGVFNKHVIDSSLEKINDVGLQQSWLGRIFDYGDIDILTGADEGINRMGAIAQPLEFKRAMLEAKHEYERGYGYLDPQAVASYAQGMANPKNDIRRTLEALAALRDQGLLTSEEFEAKKRELLSRL